MLSGLSDVCMVVDWTLRKPFRKHNVRWVCAPLMILGFFVLLRKDDSVLLAAKDEYL